MKKDIPIPILKRIWTLAFCAIAILTIGMFWSVANQDSMMRMLSIATCFAISIKAVSLYRTAKSEEYEIVDGVILSRQPLPLQKKQEIIIANEEIQNTLILAGKTPLKGGASYRLYIEKQRHGLQEIALSPKFLPGRSLLGYEIIEPATDAKK